MRIVFMLTGADLYGASRSAVRLTSRLVRDGHAVAAALPYDGPLREVLQRGGVQVHIDVAMPLLLRGQLRRPAGLARLARALVASYRFQTRLLREFRADLVHTNTATVFPTAGYAARRRGCGHVWHIRESFEDFPRLWRFWQRVMCRGADVVIAVSQPVAEQFAVRFRGKVTVLHNGFPADEFLPVAPERIAAFRQRYGLNDHALVGVVGRLKLTRKGQDVFIRAVARIRKRHPDVRFLLMGSPFPGNEAHGRHLAQMVRDLGLEREVVFTGDVDDIPAAMSALNLLVLPSAQAEPFSGSVVEAMAFGKPVLGTRLGGTVEQIEDGVSGMLVPPGDAEAMAEAMSRLLRDPDLQRRMGAAGRARFLERFEFEPYYAAMLRIYRQVLERQT